MPAFRWVSTDELPPRHDLRLRGWLRVPANAGTDGCLAIAPCGMLDAMGWLRFLIVHGAARRRRFILLDVADSKARARLLRLGFADVLGPEASLDELEARAIRVALHTEMLPRFRDIGRLKLDFLARDGFADDRPIGLHPREFELLWRLSDEPGLPVSKTTLVRDVWRQRHLPETNSLAVHVSRLRDKLRLAGLQPLVGTAPTGGYLLLLPGRGRPKPGVLPAHDPALGASQTAVYPSAFNFAAGEDSNHEA